MVDEASVITGVFSSSPYLLGIGEAALSLVETRRFGGCQR
jgi:hypothetical protein